MANASWIYGMCVWINTGAVILCQIPIAKWCERRGYAASAVLGAVVLAASFPLLALYAWIPALVAGILVYSLGELLLSPSATMMLVDFARGRSAGRYLSVGKMRTFAAMPISGWLGGTMIGGFGRKGFVLAFALPSVLGLVILFNVSRARSWRREPGVSLNT